MLPFGLFGPPDVARLKAKRDLKGLLKALNYQKDTAVRRNAAAALEAIGAPAVEPLVAVIQSGEHQELETVAKVLGNIGDNRAVNALIAAAQNKSGYCLVERAAIEALAKIGDRRAIEPLVVIYRRDRFTVGRGVASEAAHALMALGWQPDDMIEQLRFWMFDKDWWDKCVELGSRAVPYLILQLDHRDTFIAAATILERIGDTAAVKPLEEIVTKAKGIIRYPPQILWDGPTGHLQKREIEDAQFRLSVATRALENLGHPLEAPVAVTPAADTVLAQSTAPYLGGMGEPYCSQKCYEIGAQFALIESQVGKCGFCGRPVRRPSVKSTEDCAIVPFEGSILLICPNCGVAARQRFSTYHKCSVCQKEI